MQAGASAQPLLAIEIVFFMDKGLFVCVEVLRPSQPNGICRAQLVYLARRLLGRLSPLSGLPVLCTFFRQKLITALLESAEGRE